MLIYVSICSDNTSVVFTLEPRRFLPYRYITINILSGGISEVLWTGGSTVGGCLYLHIQLFLNIIPNGNFTDIEEYEV